MHTTTTYHPGMPSAFAILAGMFLLIEGAWGLFSPIVFGALTTNTLHALIHIALGVAGIAFGYVSRPIGYLLFVGGLLLAVGVLWMVPGVGFAITQLLAVNGPVAMVNIVLGAAALAMGLYGRSLAR
jgi:hypothetical protein